MVWLGTGISRVGSGERGATAKYAKYAKKGEGGGTLMNANWGNRDEKNTLDLHRGCDELAQTLGS